MKSNLVDEEDKSVYLKQPKTLNFSKIDCQTKFPLRDSDDSEDMLCDSYLNELNETEVKKIPVMNPTLFLSRKLGTKLKQQFSNIVTKITKSLTAIEKKNRVILKYYKRQTNYFVAHILKQNVVSYKDLTYFKVFGKVKRDPSVEEALADLSECPNMENKKGIEKVLESIKMDGIDKKSALMQLFFELPQLFDIVNAAILFDYADKLKFNREDEQNYKNLQDLMQVKSPKEEEKDSNFYTEFIQKTMCMMRCFNRLIVDDGK